MRRTAFTTTRCIFPDGSQRFLKVRSLVGLIPLLAVETLEPEMLAKLPDFRERMQWFLDNVPTASAHIDMSQKSPNGPRRLLSLVSRERLLRVLGYMLDEKEFLSPHGIRSLSRFHLDHPYTLHIDGTEYRVGYEPAESRTGHLRRKLQLERADLVPGKFSDHRVLTEIPLLFRR